MADDTISPAPPLSTDRYTRKKEAIVASATGILNRRGVKGMTLADVAASVDLITTSVTYYFRKKEDLAVACFLGSIERLEGLVGQALEMHTPQERLDAFLVLYFALARRIREGEDAPIAIFSDIRALKDPHFGTVLAAYQVMFRKLREVFRAPGFEWMNRKMATVRTYMLLEQLYWTAIWLPRYDVEDYARVRVRMLDILSNGVVAGGAQWTPAPLADLEAQPSGALEVARETFLIAATRLINQRGYRGASVEKISAQLNVTKGSFYHHNEAKDDLVVACFERTFEVMRRAQRVAMARDGNFWDILSSIVAALVEYQLSERGPLLRVSALTAVPEPIRLDMVDRFNRISERFAGMIADGIAEGSLHAVDPFIAAQLLNATLNGTADIELYLPGMDRHEIAELYARPVLMGIFSR